MPASYRKLQLYAIFISILSVVYNAAEGGISIGFGAESASRSLMFFGIQSGVEVLSALVVLWRFRKVAKPGEERDVVIDPQNLRVEYLSTLAIGSLLFALALGTIATAISILVLHQEPDSSNASLIISAVALVLMVLIWLPKRYLARALNSSAMHAEAICSLSCVQITVVLFIGSLVYRVWKGGWWVDGATSIILGLLFGWEGGKMIKWARDPKFDGGCCESCRPPISSDVILQDDERYRDMCDCCRSKDECRMANECQCRSDCGLDRCRLTLPEGEKCCTRGVTLLTKVPTTSCGDQLTQDCCGGTRSNELTAKNLAAV